MGVFDPPAPRTDRHTSMTLEQPWGDENQLVRIFPPCQIEDAVHRGDPVVVFIKSGKHYVRKRVGYFDLFPSRGFVAWDDTNGEYAWHEVGTIDVPSAKDPKADKFVPIIRGESETVGGEWDRKPRRKRRSLREWFLSKSQANDVPDFLRKDTK